MPEPTSKRHRFTQIAICAGFVLLLAFHVLAKMDYLSSATISHVRLTDSSRTAYVAKNIANGDGYTTNDIPAYLIDFYDKEGKLHTDHWPNADRFPFAAYATAVLYTITGSRSFVVGVLGYNLLCFVIMCTALFWLGRRIWNQWVGLAALGFALIHQATYTYLYWKDADTLALVIAAAALLYEYYRSGRFRRLHAVATGTVFSWLYLARPNVGGPLLAYFALLTVVTIWRQRRSNGLLAAVRAAIFGEILVLVSAALWIVPFVIHNLQEWGSPLFSANAIYQLPLGTRFAMDTDTWWKYSEPGRTITIASLLADAPGQLLLKFTTSWFATLRETVKTWALEIVLATIGLVGIARGPAAETTALVTDETVHERAFLRVAKVLAVIYAINFFVLPLYGYQNQDYSNYLSFYLPIAWLACGRVAVAIARLVGPWLVESCRTAWERVRANPAPWIIAPLAIVIVWSIGAKSQDANPLAARASALLGAHWQLASCVLAAVLLFPTLRASGRFVTAAALIGALVWLRYEPRLSTKRYDFNWFTANRAVWSTLREGHGPVMSLALQGEVAWETGRQNIPAPENILHLYSLLADHHVEVEDVYIESAETLRGSADGPLFYAAPGFESYGRLQRYRGELPGYELSYNDSSYESAPEYGVKEPRLKASTVYHLHDRAAVASVIATTPTKIELGDPANVIYTTYGWGDYTSIDGRRVVEATDATRTHYTKTRSGNVPWEDSSISFFVGGAPPAAFDLDVYFPGPMTLSFFWNLDLFFYDTHADRQRHAVGEFHATAAGWQTIHLEVPAQLVRKGVNKLGFRTSTWYTTAPGVLRSAPLTTTGGAAAETALTPVTSAALVPASVKDTLGNISVFVHELRLTTARGP